MTEAHTSRGDVPAIDLASPSRCAIGMRSAEGRPIATVHPEPRPPASLLPADRDLNDPLVQAAPCRAGKGVVDLQPRRPEGAGAPRPGPRLMPRRGKGGCADLMLFCVDGEEEFATGFRGSQSLRARAVLIAVSGSKVRP